MSRDPNSKVTLTYRLPEWLRAKLEEAAKSRDWSLNNEINRRLEQSFEALDLFAKAVGGQDIADDLRLYAMAMRRTAMSSGGMDDQKLQILATIIAVCELQAGLEAAQIKRQADSPDSDWAWKDGFAVAEAFLKNEPDPMSKRESPSEIVGR
jgi:hypothetical protein